MHLSRWLLLESQLTGIPTISPPASSKSIPCWCPDHREVTILLLVQVYFCVLLIWSVKGYRQNLEFLRPVMHILDAEAVATAWLERRKSYRHLSVPSPPRAPSNQLAVANVAWWQPGLRHAADIVDKRGRVKLLPSPIWVAELGIHLCLHPEPG